MLRRLARKLLLVILTGSLAATGFSAARIAADPQLAPLRSAARDEIIAETDRLMAQLATADRLAGLISTRLLETPRNWVALDALQALAAERTIALPPHLLRALGEARDEDTGLWAEAQSCAACAYDPAQCALGQVLICQAPVALTPVGDLAGVARAGVAYASGAPVDQIDLALSLAGLAASVAVLATAGSSAVIKAGASLAKLARRMGRLSPRLVEMATDAVRLGVDWAALPGVRSVDDLGRAIRAEAFVPLAETLTDLDRVRRATDATAALHLLPLVDTAADARRLADTAEALGPRLIGRAEVLGKARLLRAAVRVSGTAWALISGLMGLMAALTGLIGSALHSGVTHALRRAARPPETTA